MMKLCIISPNFLEPTAWMVSAYKTAIMLKKSGHDVCVLTTRTKGSKARESVEGIRVYRMPSIFVPDPFNYTIPKGLRSELKRIMSVEDPDFFIVSKHMFYTSLSVFPLKRAGRRVIVQTDTFPGKVWFTPSAFLNTGMFVYSRLFGNRVLRRADKVVLLHEGLERAAKDIGLNYTVIHNGIDMAPYRKAKPAEDLKRGKEKLITYVGRLDEVKGYRLFIKMAKRLHSQGVSARFLMVVGDKHPERRMELARRYPYIMFTGFRKDIPEIWAASEIGVLPSHAEGLPNTVMEAMASGVPVVASAVGGVTTLIQHRENGMLFKAGDLYGLTRDVRELLMEDGLRQRLGKKAKEKVEKGFDLVKLADEWKRLFKGLM